MNIVFLNQSKVDDILIRIEPSTDEFTLKPNDEIKVECESLEEIMEIYSSYVESKILNIWLPRNSKGVVYINNVKVWSLAETRYW